MFLTGQAEIDKAIRSLNEAVAGLPAGSAMPLVALPLYASLPPELQVGGGGGEAAGEAGRGSRRGRGRGEQGEGWER